MPWLLAALGVLAIGLLRPSDALAQDNPFSNCKASRAAKLQFSWRLVDGETDVHEGRLVGDVQIDCDDSTLFADEVHWREDSDMVFASGNVVFQQGTTRISADRAEMDRKTHLGTFFNAAGQLELSNQKPDKSLFGTQEPDAMFRGDEIEKLGEHVYKLTHGSFTTCLQPTPRWEMVGSTVVLVQDKHALLKNMVLKVKDVPIFYLPAIYYPIDKAGRSTGFLMPNYGNSSVQGFKLSNAFFWAIDRSQDATFYHDYYAKTGQGFGTEYRYVEDPGSQGTGTFHMLDETAQYASDGVTLTRPAHKSYQINSIVSQRLGGTFRLQGHVNYFTDISAQQAYQQNIFDSSQRTRSFGAALTGSIGRYRLSGSFDQTDVFYNTTPSQRYGSEPSVNFSVGEKPIGNSHIYFGADSSAGYFVRQDRLDQPGNVLDNSLFRLDGAPTIRATIGSLSWLRATTSAAWRYTFWSDSLGVVNNTPTKVPVSISRELVDLEARITGPIFSRIWHTEQNSYAEGFKHSIEPNLTVIRISSFDRADEIVQQDSVDTIVPGVTQLRYGITNRLLAKRRTGGPPPAEGQPAPSVAREILTVDVNQSYYSDSRASIYDAQYQSASGQLYSTYQPPSPYSPVQISVTGRPTDAASVQFRMEYDAHFKAVRTYTASGSLYNSIANITGQWSKRQYIPGLQNFDDPSLADQFLFGSVGLKYPDNRVGGTFSFNYDMMRDYFLQRRIQVYYNSQCCGVAFDLQTVNRFVAPIPGLPPTDRRFTISFTLAGLGTFSNPLGSFGGNSSSR
jgi:LPS-assembly protein